MNKWGNGFGAPPRRGPASRVAALRDASWGVQSAPKGGTLISTVTHTNYKYSWSQTLLSTVFLKCIYEPCTGHLLSP